MVHRSIELPIELPMWIFGRNPHHGRRRLDAARLVIPGHVAKEIDNALCKQFREQHPKQKDEIIVRLFRYPLRYKCGFLAGIRIMEGADWMQLDWCGKRNANSHYADTPKYLKYDAQ